MFGVSDGDNGVHFFNQFLLLLILKLHVPLGQPRLACPVLNQDEPDLTKKEVNTSVQTLSRGWVKRVW